MSKHELAIADRWFEKRGEIIILVARLLPVIRTFIAFPAGVARMNRVKFHVYTFVGSLPWCLGLGYVGQQLGLELMSEHSPLKHFMHKFDAVIAAAIVIGAVVFVRSRLKALRAYKDADAAADKAAPAAEAAAAPRSSLPCVGRGEHRSRPQERPRRAELRALRVDELGDRDGRVDAEVDWLAAGQLVASGVDDHADRGGLRSSLRRPDDDRPRAVGQLDDRAGRDDAERAHEEPADDPLAPGRSSISSRDGLEVGHCLDRRCAARCARGTRARRGGGTTRRKAGAPRPTPSQQLLVCSSQASSVTRAVRRAFVGLTPPLATHANAAAEGTAPSSRSFSIRSPTRPLTRMRPRSSSSAGRRAATGRCGRA